VETAKSIVAGDFDEDEEEEDGEDENNGGCMPGLLPGIELFSLGRGGGREGGAAEAAACLLYLAPATPPTSDLEEYPGGSCFSGSSPASSFAGTSPASSYVSLSPPDDLLSPPLSVGLEFAPGSPSGGGSMRPLSTLPPPPPPPSPSYNVATISHDNLNLPIAIQEKHICSLPSLPNDASNEPSPEDVNDDVNISIDNERKINDDDEMQSLLEAAHEAKELDEEDKHESIFNALVGQQDDNQRVENNARTIIGTSPAHEKTIKDEPANSSNKKNNTNNIIENKKHSSLKQQGMNHEINARRFTMRMRCSPTAENSRRMPYPIASSNAINMKEGVQLVSSAVSPTTG
jgi:hypothetical protein